MSHPLVDRYASQEMREIFSPGRKFRGWRECWIALAEAEMEMGLDIRPGQVAELKAHTDDFDLERARQLEKQTKHDVMAHILHYGEQCPEAKPIIHLGATSMYPCDNTELLQMRDALELVRDKLVVGMHLNANNAMEHKDLACLGYTHLQPAQPTTLGKRMSLWLQDFYMAFQDLEFRLDNYQGRGIKGTTGTQDSFMKLFDGDEGMVEELDRKVIEKLGFTSTFPLTGQTYPRLFDYQVLSSLAQVAISAQKAGVDIRLMQQRKELEEPFSSGQVGSSAMPYKRNPSRTERMCSIARHVVTLSQEPAITASEQMHERTLDDSAGRRIYIPDSFYATDAVLDLYNLLMDGIVVYPRMIERHLMDELPFMVTEEVMMEAVKAGGDRQDLHDRIKQHSIEAGRVVKEYGGDNDLLYRIANDPDIPVDLETMQAMSSDYGRFVGRAPTQVEAFVASYINPVREKYAHALDRKSGVDI